MSAFRTFTIALLLAFAAVPAVAQTQPKTRYPDPNIERPENVRAAGPYLIKLSQRRGQILLTITTKDRDPVATADAVATATAQIGGNIETVAFEPSPVAPAGSKGVANQMVSMNRFSKPVIGKVAVNVTITLAGRNPVAAQFPPKPEKQ